MVRFPGVRLLVASVMLAGFGSSAPAQGGWRSWDVHLRDGSRVEANPLGAPDDRRVSTSVGGLSGRGATIPRSRIDFIAAQSTVGPNREPVPGVALPAVPTGRVCADVVVHSDGRRTTGRVTLTRIAFSEGVVHQRGTEINLRDIAFIKFADGKATRCGKTKPRSVSDGAVPRTPNPMRSPS